MSFENGEKPEDLDAPVEPPVDGILDLHLFRPADIKSLVPEYIRECRRRGILRVRIIHGKGAGVQRRVVHSILSKTECVVSFRLAGVESGGWGATIADLEPE